MSDNLVTRQRHRTPLVSIPKLFVRLHRAPKSLDRSRAIGQQRGSAIGGSANNPGVAVASHPLALGSACGLSTAFSGMPSLLAFFMRSEERRCSAALFFWRD